MSLRLRIKNIFKKQEGQSLVEILVGLSIGALIIGSATIAIVVLLRSGSSSERFQQIALIAQDTIEKVHSISDSSWANLNNLDKGSANNYFFMASSTETLIVKGKEGVVSGGINSGLVAHWKMDEEGGNITYDYSNNNNIGSLQNSPTRATSTDCRVGGCLSFDGVNDIVDIKDGALITQDNYTIAGWINLNSLMSGDGIIFANDGNSGSEILDSIGVRGGKIAWNYVGGGTYKAGSTIGFNVGNWGHFAFTSLNGRTGTVKIFINGKEDVITTTGFYRTADRVQIGGRTFGSEVYFDGFIDDIRIYNRALSSDEVWNLYNSNIYQRHFYVEDVCRTNNVSYEIDGVTPCGVGSVRDPNTLKVTVVIEWDVLGQAEQFELSDYVTRWRNRTYTQTDWSGSSGEDGPYANPTSNFSTSTNIDFSGGQ